MHCEIVHRVASDCRGAGCVTHPASEISLEESLGRCLSQREAGVTRGLEHPRAVRVGLVFPAFSLVCSFVSGFGNGIHAEAV